MLEAIGQLAKVLGGALPVTAAESARQNSRRKSQFEDQAVAGPRDMRDPAQSSLQAF